MNKDLGINTRSGEIKQRVTPHLILGIFVVLVGIIFLLDNLEILRAGDYLRYWPTILIVIGLSKLAQSRETPGRAAGVVFTLAGTFLLLNELRFLKLEIWDYWPLILVVIGISMIWQAIFRRGVEVKEGQPDPCSNRSWKMQSITVLLVYWRVGPSALRQESMGVFSKSKSKIRAIPIDPSHRVRESVLKTSVVACRRFTVQRPGLRFSKKRIPSRSNCFSPRRE